MGFPVPPAFGVSIESFDQLKNWISHVSKFLWNPVGRKSHPRFGGVELCIDVSHLNITLLGAISLSQSIEINYFGITDAGAEESS